MPRRRLWVRWRWWLYGLFALVPLLAIPLGLSITRGETARAQAQAAE